MATLTRWEPTRELATLRSTMDRLFDETFGRSLGFSGPDHRHTHAAALGIDLYETGDQFVLVAAVPGVDPKDVDISVDDDLLTIKGTSRYQSAPEGASYHRRELRGGEFRRLLRLPPTIDAENARAGFENGLLTLTLPKRPESRSRSFKIKPAQTVDGAETAA